MSSENNIIYWVPLESSPDAMNKVIYQLGVEPTVAFSDVYGFDEDLLAMVSQPVYAVVFLFPLNDKYDAARKQEMEASKNRVSSKVWFMKQTIGNACGTMAIFHSLANTYQQLPIAKDAHILKFLDETKDMDPQERPKVLELDQVCAEAHAKGAADGQTAAPEADAQTELHYVAFVQVDGDLYELDGRQSSPINLGPCQPDLLRAATQVIKQRIASFENGSLEFSVISLGKQQ